MAAPPTLPPMESTDSFNPDFNNVPTAANGSTHADGAVASPIDGAAPAPAPAVQPHEQKQDAPDPQVQQKVQDVLHSDIGVNTLLNRLKASIASARVSRPAPGHCISISPSADGRRTLPASLSGAAQWRRSTPTASRSSVA